MLVTEATKLRAQALEEYLDDWEREHGELTPEELAKAAADLQLTSSPSAS